MAAADVLNEIVTADPIPHQGPRVAAAIGTLRLAGESDLIEDFEERIRKLEAQSNAENQ